MATRHEFLTSSDWAPLRIQRLVMCQRSATTPVPQEPGSSLCPFAAKISRGCAAVLQDHEADVVLEPSGPDV